MRFTYDPAVKGELKTGNNTSKKTILQLPDLTLISFMIVQLTVHLVRFTYDPAVKGELKTGNNTSKKTILQLPDLTLISFMVVQLTVQITRLPAFRTEECGVGGWVGGPN